MLSSAGATLGPRLIEPDRATLDEFLDALFRYADPNSYISARAFIDGPKGGRPVFIEGLRVDDPRLSDRIFEYAQKAARHDAPANFCPPVATFVNGKKAGEDSVMNGLALVVECDAAPGACRKVLTELLAEPTLIVASGGTWTDPQSGVPEERLHLYWRLAVPTLDAAGHAELKQARRLACELVGADASAVPLSHPLRWAGSVHRKSTPKLARIVSHTENEIELAEALKRLRAASLASSQSGDAPRANAPRAAPAPAGAADLDAALAVIPNDNLEWHEWNKVGMAIWAATAGNGLALFDRWSRRSAKYDEATTKERWLHLRGSPPTKIGKGYLFSLADKAAPEWRGPTQGCGSKGKCGRSERAPQGDEGDQRPVIRMTPGDMQSIVDQAEDAMITAGMGVYQRGGYIVCVGTMPMVTARGREITSPSIFETGENHLLELMMAAASFEKSDARAKAFVPCSPPITIAKTLKERRGKLRLQPLSGLINAPTMRGDGSVIETPGYDQATGLLYDPAGVEFPPVPARPTREDAEAALGLIEALIAGFPFVGDADRSVALAAILTACVRKSLRTAPAFAFTAPVAGSGKSTLVDLMSIIATGKEAGVIAIGRTPEEAEKRVGAILLAGNDVAIDNVEGEFGSELLCQLLTQQIVRMRVLGRSEAPELQTNVMVTVTGNNLVVQGDMTRRTLLCQLDPKVERPELRTFQFDPATRAKEQRGQLLVAALTVLRAYQVAGRPARAAKLGSFSEWSDLIRSALMWLGCADPVDSIEQSRAYDPDVERLRAVMLQWGAVIGNQRVTASEVVHKASERKEAFQEGKGAFLHPEFRAVLLAVAGANGFIETGKLGTWLRKVKARIIDGMKFDPAGMTEGSRKWQLVLPPGYERPEPPEPPVPAIEEFDDNLPF